MIASKYEEITTPSVSNFVILADNTYTNEELLKAERYMLVTLDYVLCYPSPLTFLRRVSKADEYDIRSRTIGKYFLECSLLDSSFMSVAGSLRTAAAIYLARKILKSGEWNSNLEHYSGYSEEELLPCVELYNQLFRQKRQYEAAYKKYSTKKFIRVSQYIHEYYQQ